MFWHSAGEELKCDNNQEAVVSQAAALMDFKTHFAVEALMTIVSEREASHVVHPMLLESRICCLCTICDRAQTLSDIMLITVSWWIVSKVFWLFIYSFTFGKEHSFMEAPRGKWRHCGVFFFWWSIVLSRVEIVFSPVFITWELLKTFHFSLGSTQGK